jgi:hypothetical protein
MVHLVFVASTIFFFNRVSYIAFMRRWGHRSSALTVFVWQLDGGGGGLNNVSLARLRVMLHCIGEMAADFCSSAMVTANCGCVAMYLSEQLRLYPRAMSLCTTATAQGF